MAPASTQSNHEISTLPVGIIDPSANSAGNPAGNGTGNPTALEQPMGSQGGVPSGSDHIQERPESAITGIRSFGVDSWRDEKYTSLARKTLRNVPFALLPGDRYRRSTRYSGDLATEGPTESPRYSSVREQNTSTTSVNAGVTETTVTVVCPWDGDSDTFRLTAASIACQPHRLTVVVPCSSNPETAEKILSDFGLSGVLIVVERDPVREVIAFLNRTIFTPNGLTVLLEREALLHPEALTVVGTALEQKGADFLTSGTLLLNEERNTSTGFVVRPPLERYTLLGSNGAGEMAVLSNKALLLLHEHLTVSPARLELLSIWSIALLVGSLPMKRISLPLALTAIREQHGRPIRNLSALTNTVVSAATDFAERARTEITHFEPATSEGILYLKPVPARSTGRVHVLLQALNSAPSGELRRTLRTLLAQEILNDLSLTIVYEDERSRTDCEAFLKQSALTHFSFVKGSSIRAALEELPECDYLLFLGAGVELLDRTGLSTLRDWCALTSVGAVSGSIRSPIDISEAGLRLEGESLRPIRTTDELAFILRESRALSLGFSLFRRSVITEDLRKLVSGETISDGGLGPILTANLRSRGMRALIAPWVSASGPLIGDRRLNGVELFLLSTGEGPVAKESGGTAPLLFSPLASIPTPVILERLRPPKRDQRSIWRNLRNRRDVVGSKQ